MNPQPDPQDLTTYAMGELSPDQEREMRLWLASNPAAQAELARIEQVSDALHHGAHIPADRLTPRQRQNVLTPSLAPRVLSPMMPRKVAAQPRPQFATFFTRVAKIAAVFAVAAGAFLLGKQAGGPVSKELASNDQPQPLIQPKAEPALEKASSSKPASKSVEKVAVDVTQPSIPEVKIAGTQPASVTIEAPAKPPVVTPVIKQPAPALAKAEAPKQTASVAASPMVADGTGFTTVSRNASSRVLLRPHQTRPVPLKPNREMLASPIQAAPGAPQPAAQKERAPDLQINSWKAEIATCPWNPAHKLLRVLVQLPADQPAAASPANAYPLQVGFDNLTVRSYRLLSESHVPPQPGSNSAAHVMWYEVITNGTVTDANRETGRPVATITLPNARFTSQPVGPFDGSRLQAMDRGIKWENAREDYLFESAIVGFGLLLRGEQNLGSLDLDLVLKLAGQAKGDDAGNSERSKFIRLVQEAKKITGS